MAIFADHERCDPTARPDRLIRALWGVVRLCVRVLALLMTLVIVWGLFDVVWVLYERLTTPPAFLLNINDILATFGAFMAVLIAIEIFANIIIYLESEMIHLKLVLSTALMAAARKVIVLDFSVRTPWEVVSLGAVILALSLAYWLTCMGRGRGLMATLRGIGQGRDADREHEEAGSDGSAAESDPKTCT